MRLRNLVILVLAIAMVGVSAVSADEHSECEAVGGTLLIQFIEPTVGLAVMEGDLSGTVRGVVVEQTPNEDGSMSMALEHVILTDSGDMLMTTDEATFTPVTEDVFLMNQTQTFVGGTGEYDGATGEIVEFGAVNMATGQGVVRYEGTLCRAS